jgi:hypothetical protein
VEQGVVPFAELLLGDYARGFTLGHTGRIGGPIVDLTSVAILVGKKEFNEPVPVNVNVNAPDVDFVAKHGVEAFEQGNTISLHANIRTNIRKAKSIGHERHQGTVRSRRSHVKR